MFSIHLKQVETETGWSRGGLQITGAGGCGGREGFSLDDGGSTTGTTNNPCCKQWLIYYKYFSLHISAQLVSKQDISFARRELCPIRQEMRRGGRGGYKYPKVEVQSFFNLSLSPPSLSSSSLSPLSSSSSSSSSSSLSLL